VFSDKHASDKILSYKFGGDFNSGLEEILAQWKKRNVPVEEIIDSCHTKSRERHRRRRISIWNQRKEQTGAMVGRHGQKNVLLQGGTKYRFDLSNGKSYHLHTTGLFTPRLW